MCSLAAAPVTMWVRLAHSRFPLRSPYSLGSNDVGWSDASVLSPELDKLAEAGVKLSSCYTWDWCAPSRGAMLSGKYP